MLYFLLVGSLPTEEIRQRGSSSGSDSGWTPDRQTYLKACEKFAHDFATKEFGANQFTLRD